MSFNVRMRTCTHMHVHACRLPFACFSFFSSLQLSDPQLSPDSDTRFHHAHIEMYLGHVCHYALLLTGEGMLQSIIPVRDLSEIS